MIFAILVFFLFISQTDTKVINFQTDMNAIPNDGKVETCVKNTKIMNSISNILSSNDKFIVPNNTFYLMGGIKISQLESVIFQIEGTLVFTKEISKWPRDDDNKPLDCIYFESCNNITFTSSSINRGFINGNGEKWWGIPFIGTLIRLENRPKLFHMKSVSNIIIEHLKFSNSPYWTVHIEDVNGLIIRYSSIINKRTSAEKHSLIDLSAFNTDGFDIQGENVHIHDCYIWTQDDCIAVKGNSRNMLFERNIASGVGLTIGSIGGEIVNNITFRDTYMPNTGKGIYMKFNGAANDAYGGRISNILYKNITILSPSDYAIWIGPAQQADARFICHANPCSLCWPMFRPYAQCNVPLYGNFSNITLEDIQVIYSKENFFQASYIGVLMAPMTNPMQNIRFINVQSNKKKKYICQGANVIADAASTSFPMCLTQ